MQVNYANGFVAHTVLLPKLGYNRPLTLVRLFVPLVPFVPLSLSLSLSLSPITSLGLSLSRPIDHCA